jgi:hypothetical protein
MLSCEVWAIESDNTDDFPKLSALYDEAGLEVFASVSANLVRNDYGVPGSPVWYEVDDATVDVFCINGVDYTFKELTAKVGDDAAELLNEICIEASIKKDDWA